VISKKYNVVESTSIEKDDRGKIIWEGNVAPKGKSLAWRACSNIFPMH